LSTRVMPPRRHRMVITAPLRTEYPARAPMAFQAGCPM